MNNATNQSERKKAGRGIADKRRQPISERLAYKRVFQFQNGRWQIAFQTHIFFFFNEQAFLCVISLCAFKEAKVGGERKVRGK